MNSPDFVDGSWLLADDADTQSGIAFEFFEAPITPPPEKASGSPSNIREALLMWLDENL